jgi:hypothetical protein
MRAPRFGTEKALHQAPEQTMPHDYLFKIDGSYSPDTVPMERLALYIGALARLLGEPSHVHFEALRPGSAILAVRVDEPAQPKVRERVSGLRTGRATPEVGKAFKELDELLRKDNAVGELTNGSGAVVIPFPGRERREPLVFGPFIQETSVEGVVIRIGGVDETIPVHLRDGEKIHKGLWTTTAVARELAKYYLGSTLRVRGPGTWMRLDDGDWSLRNLKIVDFDILDDRPLPEVIAALRRVSGSRWSEIADPAAELLSERRGGEPAL